MTDGAFEALGSRLLMGRWFDRGDRSDTEPVAVVNETFARTYWPRAEEAVGGRIRLGSGQDTRPWVRVVGIVADERHNSIVGTVKEKFYIPHSQWHVVTAANVVRNASVVVRTRVEPMRLAVPLEQLVHRLDPDLPVGTPRSMSDIVARALATPSLTTFMLAGFAAIALALAAVGIYGVLAYVVSRRTREIGIRIALGSERSHVIRLIVRQGMSMATVGVAAGAAVALALSRVIQGLLYEVTPADAETFGSVTAILLLVALIASTLPAWRAARLSPVSALKAE